MVPLLDTILDEIPAPDVDIDGPVALQICTVDHSSYEGRIGVGRLSSGTLHEKEQVLVVKPDGAERRAQIRKVYTFENLGKAEVTAVSRDIVAVIGIEDARHAATTSPIRKAPSPRWPPLPWKSPPWPSSSRRPRVPWWVARARSSAAAS